MKHSLSDRLLRREIGQSRASYAGIRGIYGDRQWVEDMDIVNELQGHTGCVNALSWSRSGRLLASGSDDHRINIYAYQPDSSTSQFSLTTSIMTGHLNNIFSVKFMPYSGDRTIVSATDDIRIFDIERSGHSLYGSSATNGTQSVHRRVDSVTLTEGDTNAKAFRCHTDTVKRIVTEDNPFYFLTCSEDGDVRQWDIRQPSRAYPPPRDRATLGWARPSDASDNVPPPLISYSRYNLDLNTISCSPSQPHYIALGGAHLHCFLHDRRMLGRDKLAEKGAKLPAANSRGDQDEQNLSRATRCVKKFAPNGTQRMGRRDSGHITACKISDANPNELIVSWSGDWIYSFDILRSPDATEKVDSPNASAGDHSHRVRGKNSKRKRPKSNSFLSQEAAARAGSRQRTEGSTGGGSSPADVHDGLALRVHYGNGQSEEIRIAPPAPAMSEAELAALQSSEHYRIAKFTVKIQKAMFNLNPDRPASEADGPGSHASNFTSVMGFAASALPEMDEIARSWRYPMDPNDVDVALQNKLRDDRAASRRFVQAAGTLARVLGGQLHTGSSGNHMISHYFTKIEFAPNERPLLRHEQFGYDLLKAILLWLDSGLGAVVEGFSSKNNHPRLPLEAGAGVDAIDDELIPYLLRLASDSPILDVDASRFETDDRRNLFGSEKGAVIALARALKVPFADLTGAVVPAEGPSSENYAVQDRHTALKRWAFKVGRGVLWNVAKKIRFSVVDRAFGGLGVSDARIRNEEQTLRERHEDIDPLEEDDPVVDAELVSRSWADQASARSQSMSDGQATTEPSSSEAPVDTPHADGSDTAEDSDDVSADDSDDSEDDSDGDLDLLEELLEQEEDDDDDDDDDDDVDENGLSRTPSGRVLWRSDFDRTRSRAKAEADVPCAPHTRVYKGHCNVKTVKDVNFFGLDDEYVVSGSDSGHVFIWDRKTTQILSILEGDGEVVNVVQGHPYEPTMAVSGIDHTIKIFSPDARDQYNARKGVGVEATDPGFSSLAFGMRRRRRRSRTSEPAVPRETSEAMDVDSDTEVAPNGLKSRKRIHDEYQITSQNDQDRQGGQQDAFITRALLAELAQRYRAHRHGDADADMPPVVFAHGDEGCNVM